MIRYCKVPLNVLNLALAVLFITENAFACSCETYGQPRKDAKEFYTKKFKGAIFTGTITSIKHDPAAGAGGITFSELTINVDQYWIGVSNPSIVLLVAGPNTSCWVDWKVNSEGFFIGSKEDNGRLYYSYCDMANWQSFNSDTEIVDFTINLLGKPKSFRKPKESRSKPN